MLGCGSRVGSSRERARRDHPGQDDEAGVRLDRWFRVHFPEVGYSYLQKLLRSGQVRVDSRRVQANSRLDPASRCVCRGGPQQRRRAGHRSPRRSGSPRPTATSSRRLILFEDEHVLVLDKPFGIAVQGGTGTRRHIDGLLAGMADRFGDRPRLVHRLDRDTTGCCWLPSIARRRPNLAASSRRARRPRPIGRW